MHRALRGIGFRFAPMHQPSFAPGQALRGEGGGCEVMLERGSSVTLLWSAFFREGRDMGGGIGEEDRARVRGEKRSKKDGGTVGINGGPYC